METGALGERLAKVETEVLEMKHDLFGNGQPGIVAKLTESIEQVKANQWRLIIALIITLFLTGNGAITLKSLLGLLVK